MKHWTLYYLRYLSVMTSETWLGWKWHNIIVNTWEEIIWHLFQHYNIEFLFRYLITFIIEVDFYNVCKVTGLGNAFPVEQNRLPRVWGITQSRPGDWIFEEKEHQERFKMSSMFLCGKENYHYPRLVGNPCQLDICKQITIIHLQKNRILHN